MVIMLDWYHVGCSNFSSRDLPLEAKQIMHSIESVVIEWCHQIRDVLQKNSAQPLLEGKNPGPLVEIEFWTDRCANLQFIMEQVLSYMPGVEYLSERGEERKLSQ